MPNSLTFDPWKIIVWYRIYIYIYIYSLFNDIQIILDKIQNIKWDINKTSSMVYYSLKNWLSSALHQFACISSFSSSTLRQLAILSFPTIHLKNCHYPDWQWLHYFAIWPAQSTWILPKCFEMLQEKYLFSSESSYFVPGKLNWNSYPHLQTHVLHLVCAGLDPHPKMLVLLHILNLGTSNPKGQRT